MIAVREAPVIRRWPDELRWGMCLLLALGLHAAGAALAVRWDDPSDVVADAPVVMIELATVPVAPDLTPTELPPGPQQVEARPEPEPQKAIENAELRLDLAKDAELPAKPPAHVEKPKDKKTRQQIASLASAPSTADKRADRAAAHAPGATSHNPDAIPNWKSALVARLERYKRYPTEAHSRGESGVAQLAFSVDRSGGVHHAHIVRGSGSSSLDRETLALVERAAPMPPPPPEVAGAQIPIVVPVRYNAR
ncbi:MAG TPA: TonB family protein [Pseudolabrys sp.]|nr:TonB family protein [Pseudolabrys sp.]